MKKDRPLSDQLYRWSDTYEESIGHIITQKKESSGPPTTARRGYSSRIPDRTLQKMWKTRLPVCQRTRAWPQILSFSKPNRGESSDGLCPPELSRAGRGLPDELSINQENPERNLHYQYRTAAPQRTIVVSKYVCRHYHKHRYRQCSRVGCQYDPRTVKDRVAGNFQQGGESCSRKYRTITQTNPPMFTSASQQ